jgi:hypothetical protein
MSMYSVFIFENFLEKKYLDKITKKVENLTNGREKALTNQTNVKAVMTDWCECLKHSIFENLNAQIIQFLNIVYRLRSQHHTMDINYIFKEMWAMRHKKGDHTLLHDHAIGNDWSGAFYLKVPGETIIDFPEFTKREQIKENSLYLFPSMIKHEVFKQKYDEHRLSLAFNINVETSQI